MVEALLVHCLQNIGERGEKIVLMAFGGEMHLAGVDCLPIAGSSLLEPLGQHSLRRNTRRVSLNRHRGNLFKRYHALAL